jgi:hypothetical protein
MMDFGDKPYNDIHIVRGFMAKIGDKDQSGVYQCDRIGLKTSQSILKF